MSLMDDLWMKANDFIRGRKRYYEHTFNNSYGKATLADIARFCHMGQGCWDDNQRKTDVLIGRQEVFLRIQQHLNLSADELTQLYVKPELRAFAPEKQETTDEG